MKLASSGPYGPLLARSGSQDKVHPFLMIQRSQIVQLEMFLLCWKQFYASLDGSVRQEMLLYDFMRI